MLAIVFDEADYYGSAAALLDQGFNTPVAAEASVDHLPKVVPDASLPPPPSTVKLDGPDGSGSPAAVAIRTGGGRSFVNSPLVAAVVFLAGLTGLVALRRRTVVRRQQARAEA